ncbi:uncharacterized protein TRIADDRAFT_28821 [Trichoplax adhaerens]|uniref:Lipid droplet-associated hydrolase n=1 Tax=Trichoplax adhaerens TaxID=10228 RepID=B3S478_TRIAD|nr:hypothetical protein TRIADDRAFT_28821 [Trichoplax adhaerens]EDV22597.1 hypothetical protein TRIADDRAFT_28821 [Trichoplax adhaerens]|eukprot:XP_002115141.1 hypothetical protein TRIADDRAFT_28821 [Trichoplax adhaerens]
MTDTTRQLYNLTRSVCYTGKIPTKYFTLSPVNANREGDKRILIIPGNPGICDYYITFAIRLFQATGCRLSIDCVDHAGHSGLETDVYTLSQQIQHKLDYVKQYIPDSANLILIGHSIGAHIAIELTKSLPYARVIKSFLLFPTIERMAVSPNGVRLVPKFASKFYRASMVWGCFLVSCLPRSFLEGLVPTNADRYCVEATSRLINKDVVSNCLYMANTEFREVVNLDMDGIRANLDRLHFHYGPNDEWAPQTYYQDLVDKFPQGQIVLDSENAPHAFVIKFSEHIANIVSKEILKLW